MSASQAGWWIFPPSLLSSGFSGIRWDFSRFPSTRLKFFSSQECCGSSMLPSIPLHPSPWDNGRLRPGYPHPAWNPIRWQCPHLNLLEHHHNGSRSGIQNWSLSDLPVWHWGLAVNHFGEVSTTKAVCPKHLQKIQPPWLWMTSQLGFH